MPLYGTHTRSYVNRIKLTLYCTVLYSTDTVTPELLPVPIIFLSRALPYTPYTPLVTTNYHFSRFPAGLPVVSATAALSITRPCGAVPREARCPADEPTLLATAITPIPESGAGPSLAFNSRVPRGAADPCAPPDSQALMRPATVAYNSAT